MTLRQILYRGKGNEMVENGPVPMSLTSVSLPSPYNQNQNSRIYHLHPNLSLLMGARGCNNLYLTHFPTHVRRIHILDNDMNPGLQM